MSAMRQLLIALLLLVSTLVAGDFAAYHFAGGDSPAVDRAV